MAVCRKCGIENRVGAKFCSSCGVTLKNAKTPWIVVASCLAGWLVSTAFLFWTPELPQPSVQTFFHWGIPLLNFVHCYGFIECIPILALALFLNGPLYVGLILSTAIGVRHFRSRRLKSLSQYDSETRLWKQNHPDPRDTE